MKCKFTAISFKTGLKCKNEQLTALGKIILMQLQSKDASSKDEKFGSIKIVLAQIVDDTKPSQDVIEISL